MCLIKFSIISLSLALISCSGKNKGDEPPSPPAPQQALYVAANSTTILPPGYSPTTSYLWKDGVLTDLRDVNGNIISGSVLIKDRDMYVLTTESVSGLLNIKFWKNGVATIVASVPSGTSVAGFVVSGNDVYMVWNHQNTTTNRTIKLWKNGITTDILSGENLGAASLCVSGSDVYILISRGSIFTAERPKVHLWKNGVMTVLPGNNFGYSPTSMAVSGSDVYISGNEMNLGTGLSPAAVVWKNGVLTKLNDGVTKGGSARYLCLSGTDVYIVGSEYAIPATPAAREVAKVWKNNIGTDLTNGTRDAYASYIFVSGNDVYITGKEDSQPFAAGPIPCYARLWKNGVPTTLIGGGNAMAYGGQVFIY